MLPLNHDTRLHHTGRRFHFYSHDGAEPAHVHVDRDNCSAKFWLNPVALAYDLGYGAFELRTIERIIHQNQVMLIKKWNDYFRT